MYGSCVPKYDFDLVGQKQSVGVTLWLQRIQECWGSYAVRYRSIWCSGYVLQQFLVVDLVLRHEGFGQSTVCGKDYEHSGVLDWGGLPCWTSGGGAQWR